MLGGCAYRFTNQAIAPPAGVRSVAVEAVFDTSREVVPHEILWESVQKAIAENGHLRLTDRARADAIVLIHLEEALVSPAGEVKHTATRDRDPKIFDRNDPPAIGALPRLPLAGEYRASALLTVGVRISLVHLRTREKLFERFYPMSTDFKTFSSSRAENDFLRSEEALEADFRAVSEAISRKAVVDILVR